MASRMCTKHNVLKYDLKKSNLGLKVTVFLKVIFPNEKGCKEAYDAEKNYLQLDATNSYTFLLFQFQTHCAK